MDIKSFNLFAKERVSEKIFKSLLRGMEDRLSLAEKFLGKEVSLSTPVFKLTAGQKKALELILLLSNPVEGCLYVLDEPTLGINASLREELLVHLKALIKKGNGVVVVEHDPYFISQADFVIELGYGGGEKGGYLIVACPVKEFLSSSTITASYLKGEKKLEKLPYKRGEDLFLNSGYTLLKRGINLVWGDIGPEKEMLWKRLQDELKEKGVPVLEIESQLKFRERDTVATVSGLWENIREFLLQLPEVKAKGFNLKHLSFFTKEGVCPSCLGKGYRSIKVGNFEERVICEECLGKRLNPEVLSIKIKGFTLFEILDLTVNEIFTIFERLPGIKEKVFLMEGLGITYLKLSQGISELSGGERSRLFLCRNLSKKNLKEGSFVFLSYPLQGLHLSDVQKFINWCRRLIEKGVSFVILETNPLAWFLADRVIEANKRKANLPDKLRRFYQRFFESISQGGGENEGAPII